MSQGPQPSFPTHANTEGTKRKRKGTCSREKEGCQKAYDK